MTTYHPPTPKVKQNPANVDSMSGPGAFDDEPPPEPRDGWLLVRIHVPELNVYKCLQFPSERLVWDVKQQVLSALPKVAFWFKELKESFNYGLFAPPSNGKAGKFLDEERRLGDYPFNGPVGYLELKYKRRVYKMLNLDERQLKALHTRANLRRFMECINGGQVEKIAKMCAKGLDPNFHCAESGETPLTVATGAKKPNKLLIALVNGGALLDYRTKDGTTALHRAVEKDSLEAVTTLLELGASPNYKDSRGITPLYISITRKCEPKISESLLHDHATLGIQDSQGWNEVHQACRNGLVQHLEHLLFYGADMDGHNASGNTPLHVCAVNNQEACARMLLFRGAHRGALNYANQTPYQVAVIAGNLELAEIIQNYKSDDVVPFRGAPRYNPKRRSGINWLNANGGGSLLGGTHGRPHSLIANHLTANSGCGSPSPCPSDHMPYSSASSSLSEGSSGHRSHEDDISIVTDKSLGDTSDIISDSSGVGTNSDSAACSIGHPSTTVVCMESYAGNQVGHIRLQPGDVIEVVGSTDCGLLEGYVRGSNQSGFFPAECVQEVNLRQKNHTAGNSANQSPYQHGNSSLNSSLAMYKGSPQLSIGGGSNNSSMGIGSNGGTLPRPTLSHHQSPSFSVNSNGSTATLNRMDSKEAASEQGGHSVGQYSSATAPRMKKTGFNQPRTVVLHRAKRGFGFILRGAKASSPLMQLKPSDRFPALQYLDDVDPGGVADMAGLKPGDFLLAIGGEDVRAASHEKVVEMIRSAGTLVSMTVISPQFPPMQASATPQYLATGHQLSSGPSTPQASHRQCATLPRKMSLGPNHAANHGNGGGGGRLPAPTPPRRDPKTTLSVGRARAKSMVAGLENGGERDDDAGDVPHTKSSSIESIATPAATHLGTPVQLRTASIKARPTSSRITAAELEELFQRQQGEAAGDGSNRYSTMMTTSRFQSGTDSGAATPPANTGSPMKGPLVYGSVAEMKRKTKLKNGGTLRGKPCAIPSVAGKDLKRFHSTPDLHAANVNGSAASIWANAAKGHHSQDDVATLHASMQRLNAPLPPPTHPPPPPPVGQVVKVETRNSSEYESTLSLQQKLKKRAEKDVVTSAAIDGVQSSFNPSANAKIYASPQELRNVMAWKLRQQQEARSNSNMQQQQQQPPSQQQQQQTSNCSMPPPPPPEQPMSSPYAKEAKDPPQPSQYAQPTILINSKSQPPASAEAPVYASTNQNGANPPSSQAPPAVTGPAPPIPEPDYSFSESDGEDENSILVARNTKLNEKIALIDTPDAPSTGNNSQSSGSSSGSASITHSLSVDEIQRVRNNLKTSKSSPDGFAKEEKPARTTEEAAAQEAKPAPKSPPEGGATKANNLNAANGHHAAEEEADNSSSGVSSDQEGLAASKAAAAEAAASATKQTPPNSTDTIKKKPTVTIVEQPRHIPEPSEEATHLVQQQQQQQKQQQQQQQQQQKQQQQQHQPHSSSTLQRTKTTVTISSEGMTSEAVNSGAPTVTVKQMVQQQYAPVIQQQQQQQMTASKAKALQGGPMKQQQPPQGLVSSGRLQQQAYMAEQQQQQHHALLQQQQQQLAHQQHLQQILKAKAAAANTAVIVAKQQQQLHKEKDAAGCLELEQRSDDEGSLSPSPPAKAFQRHNSLTRKQAAAIAMQRATRSSAVSLVQLPPPLETDSDNEMASLPHAGGSGVGVGAVAASPLGVSGGAAAAENIVLAPPPQFCDCNDAKHSLQFQQLQQQQQHHHQVQQQVHQQAQQQLSMQQHHHLQQRQLQQHLAMQQHQQQLQLQQHQLQLQQQQQHMQQQQQQYQLQLQGHHHGGGGQAGPGSSGTLGRVRLVPKNTMNRLH